MHPLVPHGLFRAPDGFLGGGLGGSPRMWDALLAWLVEEGAADDLTDPRWGAIRWSGKRHQEHVFEVVQRFLDKWTKEEFAVAAQSRKLPWSAVDRPDELLVNPQLNDRDFSSTVVSPDGVTRESRLRFAFPEGARARDLVVAEPGEHQALLDDCRSPEIRAPEPKFEHPSARRHQSARPDLGARRTVLHRILADHGADVVKVESLGRPDPTRFAPFMHLSGARTRRPDTSGYFNDVNRNKRSITLDTRSPAGLEVLADLIAQSDVVVENFSSTVMEKMGFGYERLRELRTDIVYVSMSGMGHTGRAQVGCRTPTSSPPQRA